MAAAVVQLVEERVLALAGGLEHTHRCSLRDCIEKRSMLSLLVNSDFEHRQRPRHITSTAALSVVLYLLSMRRHDLQLFVDGHMPDAVAFGWPRGS